MLVMKDLPLKIYLARDTGIADFGLEIADSPEASLQIRNPQSAIRNCLGSGGQRHW
jgi:hypothetical protein